MRLSMLLVTTVALTLSTAVVHADLGDQLFKLLPEDGAVHDEFGNSVAVSGTTAIVGAYNNDDNGTGSGSAYLFDTTTGQQLFKLLPNDGAELDWFGWSVAISGTIAVVGASKLLVGGNGAAYVFDAVTGQQLAKLLPDDGEADDSFGCYVAISGTIAIVGAPWDDYNGDRSGSAYLFDISDPSNPAQIAKFLPDDNAAGDKFGSGVAISGTTTIIGAYGDADNTGSAYLFDISDPNDPVQYAKLLAVGGEEGDLFGLYCGISGTTAIVGARFGGGNDIQSGAAYLFDTTTGKQIAQLLADDAEDDDNFGYQVAIYDTTAVVGAFRHDDNGDESGSAYLFDTNTGRQIAELLADDGAVNDFFGASVAICDSTVIVGAKRNDDNGDDSGSAYIFDADDCPWDIDGDGTVGASDLAELLDSWGPCKGCPADLDGNGQVGPFDLALLLGNWGPCP